ncbi:MAG: cytochrome c biogenesis protein CcsA [Deltaproteobacteria bacterium]
MKASDWAFDLLLALTGLIFAYLIAQIFFVVPNAQLSAGGIAQKIFYFHFPSIFCGFFLSIFVCFAASAGYLASSTEGTNSLARGSAECAVAFGAVMLVSGMIWAKRAWGIWWTWDPQLTTALLTVLIYLAVVILRAFSPDGAAERRFAAALGVLGAVNVPIIRYSVQKWGGNHPVVLRKGGAGLSDPAMVEALRIGFVAMALLCILFIWLRTEHHVLRSRLVRVDEEALGRGWGES